MKTKQKERREQVKLLVPANQLRRINAIHGLVNTGLPCITFPWCTDHPYAYGAAIEWARGQGQSMATPHCVLCALNNRAIKLKPGFDETNLLQALSVR